MKKKGYLIFISIIVTYLCILIIFEYSKKPKEIEMQDVTVFENYTVKLPLKANQVGKNRWKIEYSSSFTTIIASELPPIGSLNSFMDMALKKNDSDKFKLYLNSKKEIDKPTYKIYINYYKGKAGASPLSSPISFTCLILDEINTKNRFMFELNSIDSGHDHIVDSIVNSFKKK